MILIGQYDSPFVRRVGVATAEAWLGSLDMSQAVQSASKLSRCSVAA